MKKLLMTLGAIAPIAGAGTLVVACGHTEKETPKQLTNETIEDKDKVMTAEQVIHNTPFKNLWMTTEEFTKFNQGNLDSLSISKMLWMNIFDSRQNGNDEESTKQSIEYFKEHDIQSRLKLTGEPKNLIKADKLKRSMDTFVKAIVDILSGQGWNPILEPLKEAVTEYTLNSATEGIDLFELITPVMKELKSYNEQVQEILQIPVELRITIQEDVAENIGFEFLADTIVFFNGGEEHLITKSSAQFSQLTFHITL